MSGDFSISKITCSDSKPTAFAPGKLTVIVGPNNSGKSTFLKRIRDEICGSSDEESFHFGAHYPIKSIEFIYPDSLEDFKTRFDVENHLKMTPYGSYAITDYCSFGLEATQDGYRRIAPSVDTIDAKWEEEVDACFGEEGEGSGNRQWQLSHFRRMFGPMFVSFCATEDRLLFAAGEKNYGANDNESNMLSWAMDHPDLVRKIGGQTRKLFGRDIEFDLRWKGDMIIPRSHDSFGEYRASKHGTPMPPEASLLSNEGDGIKAFFAVAMMLFANKKPVCLIDEPESYLHPPQAFELGKLIAQTPIEEGQQLFVSTHSVQILKGIIEGSRDCNDVSIIRLDRKNGATVANMVLPDTLNEIMKDPVARSGKYFDGIFANQAILVESEADELAYAAMLAKCDIAADALLINTHGKHQFHKAAKFFNALGVDYKIIADLDLINDSCVVEKLAEALGFDASEVESARLDSENIYKELYPHDESDKEKAKEKYKKKFKKYDKDVFSGVEENVNRLRNAFLRHNCLILQTGELESSLCSVEYSHNKNVWINRALRVIDGYSEQDIEKESIFADLKSFLGQSG